LKHKPLLCAESNILFIFLPTTVTPNKYTALERLQLFKPVASLGVLRAALIEEAELSGEPLPNPTDEQLMAFIDLAGFKKCDEEDCDLWYNDMKGWSVRHEGKTICRMCATLHGVEIDF
jgi:hypothetical protein